MSSTIKWRTLFPILLTYFLDTFGLALIYPIFTPLIIASQSTLLSHNTPFFERTLLLGFLIAAFPLAQLICSPIIGQFSDKYGRKKTLCITIFGAATGYTLTAISIINHSLVGLFFSRFLTGVFASNLILCLAAIADMTPDKADRTRHFSLISAIGGFGFVIAIAFGGILSNSEISVYFHPSVPFWITALLAYTNFASMLLFFQETHQTKAHLGIHLFKGFSNILEGIRNQTLRTLYCVNFLFMITWVAAMQFLPTFLIQRFTFSSNKITLCFIGIGILWSLSNLVVNRRLAKSYFSGKILLINLLLLSLLLLMTDLSHAPLSFLILILLATCCASLCWTNGLATISLKTPPEIQGRILGINQSITSIAAMLGPIIGGLLAPLSEHAIYLFGGVASLSAFSVLFFKKSYKYH